MAYLHMRRMAMLFIAVCSAFGDILFTEDFAEGNDDGWTHLGAAEFQVLSQEYYIYSSGERGQGTSLNGDLNGAMSTPDYSVLCSIVMETGTSAGLVCRYVDSSQWYYRLVLKPFSGKMVLERIMDSGPTIVMEEYSVQLTLDTRYLVRMQVEEDFIRGKIWTGTPEDEPQSWNLSVQDAVQSEAGSFGLFAGGYGKVSWSMIFDDVTVSTPVSEDFHNCTWAGVKAAGV